MQLKHAENRNFKIIVAIIHFNYDTFSASIDLRTVPFKVRYAFKVRYTF